MYQNLGSMNKNLILRLYKRVRLHFKSKTRHTRRYIKTQVISPIFEEQFSNNSYGFRSKRSAEQVVIKAIEYLNDGYEWIVDIDLEKFFDIEIKFLDFFLILKYNLKSK